MGGEIRKDDIEDLDVLDADEILSDGTFPIFTGAAVVGTTTGTNNIEVSGVDVTYGSEELQPGDLVTLSGTGGADGNYTVATVVDPTNFTVNEALPTTTGGTCDTFHPAGASRVGIDASSLINTSAGNVQDAISDYDAVIASGGLPSATEVGQVLYSINGSTFTVQQPLVSCDGWLINDCNVHVVVG